MGSQRFPGKVMKDLLGKPMILWQINSLRKLDLPIVVATSTSQSDNNIAVFAENQGLSCIRGPEENVFERFWKVIEMFTTENYIRVTGDCPLISPSVVRSLLRAHVETSSEYSSNTLLRSFPDGLDAEVFTHQAFLKLRSMRLNEYQREHVTPAFYQYPGLFRSTNLYEERNLGDWRWTIDFPSDFAWLKSMLEVMGITEIPEYEQIFQFITNNPEYLRLQRDVSDVQQI